MIKILEQLFMFSVVVKWPAFPSALGWLIKQVFQRDVWGMLKLHFSGLNMLSSYQTVSKQ